MELKLLHKQVKNNNRQVVKLDNRFQDNLKKTLGLQIQIEYLKIKQNTLRSSINDLDRSLYKRKRRPNKQA